MSIKTILFDLDGTLLPMDEKLFVKTYFGLLCKRLEPLGYKSPDIVDAIWYGTEGMVKNDGSKTNEEVFWEKFPEALGKEVLEKKTLFDEFYQNEFLMVKEVCGFTQNAREVLDLAKEKGLRIICATNPIFPSIATEHRMSFAGISKDDFEYFTCYENSCFCKPNPKYYEAIMKKTGCNPKECLMVGNDIVEDMAAAKLGMEVFLLTDCLINKNNIDISVFPNGGFEDLKKLIKSL